MLRPEYLKQARDEHAVRRARTPASSSASRTGRSTRSIAVQEAAGVDVVSDGELRRFGFIGSLIEIVEGIGPAAGRADRVAPRLRRDGGLPAPSSPVLDRLRRVRSLAVEEYVYARSRTDLPVKVTLPLMLGYLPWPEHTSKVYDDVFALIDDGARILREEIAELVRLGCPYIQIDAPKPPSGTRARSTRRASPKPSGLPVQEMVRRSPQILDALVADFPDTTFGLHLCRGNNEGRWQAAGGYERLAKDVFEGTGNYDAFPFEYDDERAGSFEALADLPQDKTVVLGLVTTKASRMETPEEIRGRIEAAAEHFPLERLALSTQCGFASMAPGNPAMNADLQLAKLRLVTQVARDVWGG